jgi:fructokinase
MVFGIGEVLWDLLPSGRQLGGAPVNFAVHAAGLGLSAGVVTRVGRDEPGDAIQTALSALPLSTAWLQTDPALPTGSVSVTLSGDGVPEFVIHEPAAWDRIEAPPDALQAMAGAAAVCFGTLAQRQPGSRRTIHQLVSAASPSAWRIFDVNLRQHYFSREIVEDSLALANVLKLNDAEVPVVTGLLGMAGDPPASIERLAQRFGLAVVAVTRGAAGAEIFSQGRWSRHAARPCAVVDTVGAGDAFTAALCAGLILGTDLDVINAVANEVAAFVCASAGATPRLPERLRQRLAG